MKSILGLLLIAITSLLIQSIGEGILCWFNLSLKSYQSNHDFVVSFSQSFKWVLLGLMLLIAWFRLGPFIGAYIIFANLLLKAKNKEIAYRRIAVTHFVLSVASFIPFLIVFQSFGLVNITINLVISALLSYLIMRYQPLSRLVSSNPQSISFKTWFLRFSIAIAIGAFVFFVSDSKDQILSLVWGIGFLIAILLFIITFILYIATFIRKIK